MGRAKKLEKTRMLLKLHYLRLYGVLGIFRCPCCGVAPELWALDEVDLRSSDSSALPGAVAPTNHQLLCWTCNSTKGSGRRDYRSNTVRMALHVLEDRILSKLPDYSGTKLKFSPQQIHKAAKEAVKEWEAALR